MYVMCDSGSVCVCVCGGEGCDLISLNYRVLPVFVGIVEWRPTLTFITVKCNFACLDNYFE